MIELLGFLSDVDPVLFSLRVKFYPADPLRLTGNGKLMLYQQLKRDLIHGRLYCSAGEAAALGALIVQGKFPSFIYLLSHSPPQRPQRIPSPPKPKSQQKKLNFGFCCDDASER